MKKGWKIVALVLLIVLCVLLISNLIKIFVVITEQSNNFREAKKNYNDVLQNWNRDKDSALSSYYQNIETQLQEVKQEFIRKIVFLIFQSVYTILLLLCCAFFLYLLLPFKKQIVILANAQVRAEALSKKMQEIKIEHEEAKRLKNEKQKEKKIAKLQEKLNKYKESE